MPLNCGVGEDSWESLGLQGDPISPSQRKSVLNIHWKDWCWSWNSNTLAAWCEELTHLKRPWCWERFREGGEGDDRGWDGWMASPTQWAWVWVNSRSWCWTGKPGMLQSMVSQRVRQEWETEVKSRFLSFARRPGASVLLRASCSRPSPQWVQMSRWVFPCLRFLLLVGTPEFYWMVCLCYDLFAMRNMFSLNLGSRRSTCVPQLKDTWVTLLILKTLRGFGLED